MLQLNLTILDALIDYVKVETAAGWAINPTLDGRFSQGKAATQATQPEGEQPQ